MQDATCVLLTVGRSSGGSVEIAACLGFPDSCRGRCSVSCLASIPLHCNLLRKHARFLAGPGKTLGRLPTDVQRQTELSTGYYYVHSNLIAKLRGSVFFVLLREYSIRFFEVKALLNK